MSKTKKRCGFVDVRGDMPSLSRPNSLPWPREVIARSLTRLSIGLASALLVSSCAMVGPDFKKPEAVVDDAWSESESPEVATESQEHREWWKSFNDPTLDTLIETAYRQSLTLQIAGLRVYEARAILGVAAGALYPQGQTANASVRGIRLSENAEPVANLPPALGSMFDTRFTNYGVGVNAAWELDFWGRFRRGVESADAHLAASIATYDDFLVTLTGEVATAYVLLRTLEERLAYAKRNVALQKRSLQIARVRARNGLVTELDVQLARTLLGNTRATIPVIKTGIRKAQLALGLLLGMSPSELQGILHKPGKIPSAPAKVAVGIPADLLRRRPDIRRSELQAAAQSARIGVAQADLYPAFRLLGTVGYAADSTGDIFNSNSLTGFGAIGFSWNFLNYGRLRNNVRVQDAKFQQLVAAYKNTVLNAAREVEDGLVSFRNSRERVGYLSDSVKAARRAVDLAQTQYKDGVVSYSLVLDAQRFLVLNEDQLTEARGKVASSLIATYKALGGGWQIRQGESFVPDKVKSTMGERTNWGDLLEPAAVEPVPEEQRGSWRAPDR
jgi:NodT family efflux transporter outer membrane factor (OMF) lipoprotein